MINVLPPELKKEYSYARRNAGLLRMAGWIGVGLAIMALIIAAGLVYLQQSANDYKDLAAATNSRLESQDLAGVQKEAKGISDDIKLAVQVLEREVLFSQLLSRLAQVTPGGVTLQTITLTELQGGLDITAKSVDIPSATQLQVNLSDPANNIFEAADLVNTNCAPSDDKYRCTSVIRAQFTPDSPYYFIASPGGAQ
jgi:hypothetical protein